MKTYMEKGVQNPHITKYAQEVTSDSGSFTSLGHWQSFLDKNFYGSTDLLEAMVKRKVAVFETYESTFQNTTNYITD